MEELLLKMLDVFSYIAVVGCPILIAAKIWLQCQYQKSIQKEIHELLGFQETYTGGLLKLAVFFVLSLVYLLVN